CCRICTCICAVLSQAFDCRVHSILLRVNSSFLRTCALNIWPGVAPVGFESSPHIPHSIESCGMIPNSSLPVGELVCQVKSISSILLQVV
ncbi:hypothetical protein BDR04DRAFT_1191632, partial [Suillus decipiens]